MVTKNIYLSKEEHDIVKEYSEKWNKLSQDETIKKIIREFEENN